MYQNSWSHYIASMEMGRPNCNFLKMPAAFYVIPLVSRPLPLVRSAVPKPTWESVSKPIVLRCKNNKNTLYDKKRAYYDMIPFFPFFCDIMVF